MQSRFLLFIFLFLSPNVFASSVVKETSQGEKTQIEEIVPHSANVKSVKVLREIREEILEGIPSPNITYKETLYPDSAKDKFSGFLAAPKDTKKLDDLEVRSILKSGKDSNRIILTFLGDGYTLAEKEKYFSDVRRMVDDLVKGPTFKSYRSLFNIYAVFVSSRDSGLSDRRRLDTAFGLYRVPAGSKRGIRVGNTRAVERAIKEVPTFTDYPIIIANDDFYGGLGGRYAITTRSLNSGVMVLRHELGHNFSNVGEEYDGGQVYSGANFSRSPRVSWSQWVQGNVSVQKSEFLTGSYVWQDLGKKEFVKKFRFNKSGDYLYQLKVSAVGWESDQDVEVFLDGKKLELEGLYTKDRTFFRTKLSPIQQGEHEIKIFDRNGDGNNVLAYANGYAFPKDYDFSEGLVGAFNVFSEGGRFRGYRPTHKQCLMRDMRSPRFCSVDQENIWLRFLARVSLIDDVKLEKDQLKVSTLELSGLTFRWFKKEGRAWKMLTNASSQLNVSSLGKGEYKVEVKFETPEIRKQSSETVDSKTITI